MTFELLRESGYTDAVGIGSAISIVGALVLGQAAVEAGHISAAGGIVVLGHGHRQLRQIPNYAMSTRSEWSVSR